MPKCGKFRTIGVIALVAALAAVAAGTAAAAPAKHSTDTLQGAGSSLVAPLVALWGPAYAETPAGGTVNYSSVGSGAGIAQITARTVDFGASDAPLSPDQMAACHGCVQIPWALSATVPTYNIPGVGSAKLHLTGPVLADIFLGKITKWDDPAIRKLNPGLKLPSLAITVAHRSDGSGDTFAFTDYLSKISPQWRSQVGNNTAVTWPVGVGGKGNDGVSAIIASTPGAIGYISVAYVIANHLNWARMRNANGKYTLPSVPAIEAAAAKVTSVPADNHMSIVNPPKTKKYTGAWPLATFTYVIVPTTSPKAAALKAFIKWALTSGQNRKYTARLVFAPLPKAVLNADVRTLGKIHP